MRKKIRNFIYVNNPSLSKAQNLKIKNRSNHENLIHQAIFNNIDENVKQVIVDLDNTYSSQLFNDNQLNIVLDEESIEQLILNSLKNQGHNVKSLSNPEMIYRAFNFIKPPNLLPLIFMKLYLIKQKGITEDSTEKNYVINPFFFAFKISLDIFITSLFCAEFCEDLEEGLVNILTEKYGSDFKEIYEYVAYTSAKFANEGKAKGDLNDETFISGIQTISGISDSEIFQDLIYDTAMALAINNIEFLTKDLS